MENNKTWARISAGIAAIVGLGLYVYTTLTTIPWRYIKLSPFAIEHIFIIIIFLFLAISAFTNLPKLNSISAIAMMLYTGHWVFQNYREYHKIYFVEWIKRLKDIANFERWCIKDGQEFLIYSFIIIGLFIVLAILTNRKKNIMYSIVPMFLLTFDSVIAVLKYLRQGSLIKSSYVYGSVDYANYKLYISLCVVFLFLSIYNPMAKERKTIPSTPLSNGDNVGQTIITSSGFSSIADKLEGLKQLVDKNILTEEEFNQKKEALLKDYKY